MDRREATPAEGDRQEHVWLAGREAVLYAALFAYVFWFRIHGLDEGFILQGDQIRDWDVARRRLVDLPLSGVPSSAGGTTLGPTYFWLLWVIAAVVGPPFENLPHAGGVGISLLQSLADVVLAWALVRRTGSLLTSLAVVVLSATSVQDAVLSSTIWSPPVAVVFAKVALAGVLAGAVGTLGTTVLVTFVAWCSVQVHTTGVFVAGPAIAWAVLEPSTSPAGRRRMMRAAVAAGLIALLQVPWFVYALGGRSTSPSSVGASLAVVMQSPLSTLRPGPGASALNEGLAWLLFYPLSTDGVLAAIAAGSLVGLALSREVRLAVVGPAPLVVALAAFSVWQAGYDRHWLLVLGPSAAACLLAWTAYLPGAWPRALGVIVLCAIAGLQPARYEQVRVFGAVPGYGAHVRGCRQILSDGRALRDVTTEIPVAAGTPLWLCSILGVGLTAGAQETAIIRADGSVQYAAVR